MGVLGILGWILFASTLALGLVYRNSVRYHVERRKKALALQLNPHFLFNVLSSIQLLINQQQLTKANWYLSRFSQLLRARIEVVPKDRNFLFYEIDLLERYLELESLRFKFAYHMEVDAAIRQTRDAVPAQVIQRWVESSLAKSLKISQNHTIIIQLIKAERSIHCILESKGRGSEGPSDKRTNKALGKLPLHQGGQVEEGGVAIGNIPNAISGTEAQVKKELWVPIFAK